MSLQRDIERELSVKVQVKAGGIGVLDVYVDGERVFSKKDVGRPPTSLEVIEAVRRRQPT